MRHHLVCLDTGSVDASYWTLSANQWYKVVAHLEHLWQLEQAFAADLIEMTKCWIVLTVQWWFNIVVFCSVSYASAFVIYFCCTGRLHFAKLGSVSVDVLQKDVVVVFYLFAETVWNSLFLGVIKTVKSKIIAVCAALAEEQTSHQQNQPHFRQTPVFECYFFLKKTCKSGS